MADSNPELVIFDLDGTLVDSLGDLADSMNAVLERMGHPTHPKEDYRYFIGDGIEVLVRRTIPPEAAADLDVAGVVREMRAEYRTRWTATTAPFPGIPELLSKLRNRGIQTAVLSNKPDGPTNEIVRALFPDQPFTIVRGAVEGVPLKPDPSSCRAVLDEAGVRPERAALVGDTSIDIATGVNAGVQTIGVAWGFRPADELREAGADHIVDTPSEILDIFGNTMGGQP